MQIVHGRYQQAVAEVDDLRIRTVERRQIGRNARHTSVSTDGDITILQHLETALLLRKKYVSLIDFLHDQQFFHLQR